MPAPGYGSQAGSRRPSAANSRQASFAHQKAGAPGMAGRENSYVHKRLAKLKDEEEKV